MNKLKAEVYLSIAQSLQAAREIISHHGYRASTARLSMRDGTEQVMYQNDDEEENAFKKRIVKGIRPAFVSSFRFETVIIQPDFEELGIS